MSEKTKLVADPEVAFWSMGIKVGLPLAGVASLYLLARKGDVLALAILIVVGTVALIGLGIFITIQIMDRLRQAEQLRFTQNLYENMQLLGQMQKIQGAQAQSLLVQNDKLIRSLPDPSKIDVRQLESLTLDALYDEEPDGRRWQRQ